MKKETIMLIVNYKQQLAELENQFWFNNLGKPNNIIICEVQIYIVNIVNCDENGINKIVNAYENGQIIAYPTDTVYGIGCNPFNKVCQYSVAITSDLIPEDKMYLIK